MPPTPLQFVATTFKKRVKKRELSALSYVGTAQLGVVLLFVGIFGFVSDIPGQSGSPAVLPGVFSQLPGSCLIGVSHFPYSGPEVLRSSFPGPSSSSHLGRDVSGPLSQR